MNADQVIEGVGKAVVAAMPGDEYCFLWVDWWATCMNKSEWSGWIQAYAVVIALALPYFSAKINRWNSLKLALEFAGPLRRSVDNIEWHVRHLEKSNEFQFKSDVINIIETIRPIKLRAEFLTSLAKFDSKIVHRLLVAVDDIEEVKAQIKIYAQSDLITDTKDVVEFAHFLLSRSSENLIKIEKRLVILS